jgi:hypothetical protein
VCQDITGGGGIKGIVWRVIQVRNVDSQAQIVGLNQGVIWVLHFLHPHFDEAFVFILAYLQTI